MFLSFKLGVVVITKIPAEVTNVFTPEDTLAEVTLSNLDNTLELLIPGVDGQRATMLFRPDKDGDIVEIDADIFNDQRGSIKFHEGDGKEPNSCISHLLSKDIHEALFNFVYKFCVSKYGKTASAEKYSLVILDPETILTSDAEDADDLNKYLLTFSKMEARRQFVEEQHKKQELLESEQENDPVGSIKILCI